MIIVLLFAYLDDDNDDYEEDDDGDDYDENHDDGDDYDEDHDDGDDYDDNHQQNLMFHCSPTMKSPLSSIPCSNGTLMKHLRRGRKGTGATTSSRY